MQLLNALGIVEFFRTNVPDTPVVQESIEQVENVIESFETHATACYAPKTRKISEVESQGKVYKWVDAAGKVHFTDKPSNKSAEDLSDRYKMEKQFFRMKITAAGGEFAAISA